ncbi:putative bifunctional diguanylate cyclase/phosphodiesterase [Kushneria aurantia]|uniref:Bifunctional diguanylate cyclase/phosphodiesterase n=2 Tax=Kushneria aurantia TaxID=504092 RepID=A0ABV6G1F3_9GAMM|nr:sensor domain-containing phosphodiesterase [Kushneria aurantia]
MTTPIALADMETVGLLDVLEEPDFEAYTRLASSVLGAAMASITVLGRNRQTFTSRMGLKMADTPLESSFCRFGLSSSLLEIEDAQLDARVQDNPLVTGEPWIRFYAGATILSPTGRAFGALCVLGQEPRRLTDAERESLLLIARMVQRELRQAWRFRSLASRFHAESQHDMATGLPAGDLLEKRLVRLLDKEGASLAVVMVSLLNAQALTSQDGRRSLDSALADISQRLKASLTSNDLIGRMASDRLCIVLADPGEVSSVVEHVTQLLESAVTPAVLDDPLHSARLSAGISRYPEDAGSASLLLDRARAALDTDSGDQPGVRCYSSEMHAAFLRRQDRLDRLRAAVRSDALHQVYQPILTVRDRRLVGAEALARWRDPLLGEVSPEEFIPLIESDVGLRQAFTASSLKVACRQMAWWRREKKPIDYVSVNVPAGELYRADFVALVSTVLAEQGVQGRDLMLELTEASLITDLPVAIQNMEQLRDMGVRLAIDDFGTGYSSLRYLQQLPLDVLKIDRSFTSAMTDNETTYKLVDGIIWIARALGLTVIAEGVETPEQWNELASLKCDLVQGFLFGRPVAAGDFVFPPLPGA